MGKAEAKVRITCPFCGPLYWMKCKVPSNAFLEVLEAMLKDVEISGPVSRSLADYIEFREVGED